MEYIKDDVNVVEVYFSPEEFKNTEVLEVGWKELPNIPEKSFKNKINTECVEYAYRDMIYAYNLSDDSQKVICKKPIAEYIGKRTYTLASDEEILPTHRFPCINDINNKETLQKVYYKYNNRMFFIIEKSDNGLYTLSLRYNHSYNVDLVKMGEDWNTIYKIIERSIYTDTCITGTQLLNRRSNVH